MEQNLDSLFGRKEQLHRALAMIGEKNVHRKLAHLESLAGSEGRSIVSNSPLIFRIAVFRDFLRGAEG